MRVGIDFGGVLTETATPPRGDFLKIPPREGSFEEITNARDQGDIPFLVSKASDIIKQQKARAWLAHWKFDRLFEGMEFCATQEGKIVIAQKMGIDVMIDDTLEQQVLLDGVVRHRFLFDAAVAPLGMIAVENWTQTGGELTQIRELYE